MAPLWLLTGSEALACAVCFDANATARWAYIGTTVFLSLLPLMLIGGVVTWIWRLSKAQAALTD